MDILTCILLAVTAYFFRLVKGNEETVVINGTTYLKDEPTDEQRLFYKLIRGYDKNTRPVFNASQAVRVNIGFTLTQIFDLDEKNQVLTTNVWFDQDWVDEKLTWDPAEFNGLSKIRIPCKHIWKPDIVLYNSVEDYTDGYMQALAMVNSDGSVFWPPIVKFHSTCQIDITYFPFDDQICNMKMGSWAYDGHQLDLHNRSTPVDLSNYVSNGEWHLVSVTAKRNVVYYPCCPEPFPDVVFTIHLRRRTLYYTYNVIIPCVMLSSLTLLVFWMSPQSGEKVTLGLTVLLAFSVFMLLIAENMPATSNFVPLIGMYLTSVMGITSLSVMLAVMVSNISYKGQHQIPIPRLLRGLVIGLAKVMCTKLYYMNPIQPTQQSHGGRVSNPSNRERRNFYRVGNGNHASSDSGCALMEYELNEGFGDHLEHHMPSRVSAPAGNRTSTSATGPGRHRKERSREDEIDVILALLKKVLMKEGEKESEDHLNRQWEEAARIIDKFLFFIFLALTLLATLITLVFMPLFKPEKPTILK